MSCLSHRPSRPAYYIEDCRIYEQIFCLLEMESHSFFFSVLLQILIDFSFTMSATCILYIVVNTANIYRDNEFSCLGVPLSQDKGRSKNPGTNSSVPSNFVFPNLKLKNRVCHTMPV